MHDTSNMKIPMYQRPRVAILAEDVEWIMIHKGREEKNLCKRDIAAKSPPSVHHWFQGKFVDANGGRDLSASAKMV